MQFIYEEGKTELKKKRGKRLVKTRNDENKSNEGEKNMEKSYYLLAWKEKRRKKRMVIIRVRNNGHCNYTSSTLHLITNSNLELIRQMITWCIYSNIVNMLCGFWCVCLFHTHLIGQRTTFSQFGVIGNWWNFMEQRIRRAAHGFMCYHFNIFFTQLYMFLSCCSLALCWSLDWNINEMTESKRNEPRPVWSIPNEIFSIIIISSFQQNCNQCKVK